MRERLKLTVLSGNFTVCRLPAESTIPEWVGNYPGFLSITRTADEVSIVCDREIIRSRDGELPRGFQQEEGWKIIKIIGPLDFSLTGILAKIIIPLGEAGISVFTISTYDTDYILVKEESILKVRAILETNHSFVDTP